MDKEKHQDDVTSQGKRVLRDMEFHYPKTNI